MGNLEQASRGAQPEGRVVGSPAPRARYLAGVALGVVVTAALSSSAAFAQGMPGQSSPRLPGTSERQVIIQLHTTVEYNSNVTGGNSDVATVKGLRQDDVLYRPDASVDLVLPIGREAVFLDGAAGYDFYQYNKQLQRERIDLRGGVTGRVGPCDGGLTSGYGVHQSDQGDLPLQTTRNTQTLVSYGAQASCSFGGPFGESLSIQHSENNNSATTGVVNSATNGVNGGIFYHNSLLGSLSLNMGYNKTDYSTPGGANFPVPPAFESYNVGVSLTRPIGARLRGDASIFVSQVHSENSAISDYSTVGGRGELFYRVNPRLNATLVYDRSALPTIQQGFSFAVQQSISLDGTYRLSNRLRASLGTRWYDRTYHGGTTALPTQISSEDGHSVFGAIILTLPRETSLSLNARQDIRNTNLTVFNYRDYRVGLTATKTF